MANQRCNFSVEQKFQIIQEAGFNVILRQALCLSQFVLIFNISYCQSHLSEFEMKLWQQNPGLISKSLHITQKKGNRYLCTGTGFLVTKNYTTYLVTNYHLIPGYESEDTSKIQCSIKEIPDSIRIAFHTLFNGRYLEKTYPLYSKGERLFFTPSPSWRNPFGKKGIVDLAFLPLKNIPQNVLIDTISLQGNINYDNIKEGNIIAIFGFRHDTSAPNEFPRCDTAKISRDVKDPENNFIFFKSSKDLGGDSGSPVYLLYNNSWEFIGIESSTLPYTSKGINSAISFLISGEMILSILVKNVP
jgi:hypothetical protein